MPQIRYKCLALSIMIKVYNSSYQFYSGVSLRIDYINHKNATISQQSSYIDFKEMTQRYNKWTDYEDNILTELVEKHGTGNWSTISKEMKKTYDLNKRNGKQCRQRWFNQLDQTKQNRKWNNEEDLQLIKIQTILGTKWMEISQHFPGRYTVKYCRTDNNVKNHFYSIVRKSIRRMCRYVNIRTTVMNVYAIKPSTLSRIFVQGVSLGSEIDLQLSQSSYNGLNSFTKHDYSEITQIITFFMFDNNNQAESIQPQQKKVVEVLNKLMEINSFFEKDVSSGANSPESYSDSEKLGSYINKSEASEKKQRKMSQQEKEQVVSFEQQCEMEVQVEQEQSRHGIFSTNKFKNIKQAKIESISSICPISKSTDQILHPSQTFQELELKYPSIGLLRGESQLSLNSNFMGINIEDFMMNEENNEVSTFQMKLFATPSIKSATDSLFSKYLQ